MTRLKDAIDFTWALIKGKPTTLAGFGITDADPAGAAAAEAALRTAADSTHAALTTTAHGGIVASTDARLSDARTPTAHVHTEANVTGLVGDVAAKLTPAAGDARYGQLAAANAWTQPQQWAQSAEQVVVPVVEVSPFTPGAAPFQIRANSFPNAGGGAGTWNHGVWVGFNAGRHAGGGVTANQPAIMMGFEDNYYDTGGDSFRGVEWYVQYFSPDGTSVQRLRPFYARIECDNNLDNGAVILQNIGTGASGQWQIRSGLTTLLNTTSAIFATSTPSVTLNGALLSLQPASGQPIFTIAAASLPPTIVMKIGGAPAWYTQAISATVYKISDKDARAQLTLTYGATAIAALTTIGSSLKVDGNAGFNGVAPIAKPVATPANATDLATALTLVNYLKNNILIAYGLAA